MAPRRCAESGVQWSVEALAKAGTLAIIGVYPVIAAYEAFDRRQPGWMKVELRPESRA